MDNYVTKNNWVKIIDCPINGQVVCRKIYNDDDKPSIELSWIHGADDLATTTMGMPTEALASEAFDRFSVDNVAAIVAAMTSGA